MMTFMFIYAGFSFQTPGKTMKDWQLEDSGFRKDNMFLQPWDTDKWQLSYKAHQWKSFKVANFNNCKKCVSNQVQNILQAIILLSM